MAKLLITHPHTYGSERKYIYDVIFGEFLGIRYETRVGDVPGVTEISMCGDSSGRSIILPEVLFTTSPDKWLTSQSLPLQPLEKWIMTDSFRNTPRVLPEIPVIYGERIAGDSYYAESDRRVLLGIDVFGSAFFMLTRYEEVVKADRDEHDRFAAAASLAWQEGFIKRPIINEYVEILWTCIKRLWPLIERRRREYRVLLSHDVDHPLAVAGKPLGMVIRACGGDMLMRKDLDMALRRIRGYYRSLRGDFSNDPFNTFDFIMRVSERIGVRSAFYFMTAEARSRFDRAYSIHHPWFRGLMRKIASRGHEIGYHGSYYSYLDLEKTRREVAILIKALTEEGISDSVLGGRQHYLRWQAPTTWRIWESAGLTYDSTLGFADCTGFRCGTCYEYSTYDIAEKRKMKLVERPLVVMDVSLIDDHMKDAARDRAYAEAIGLAKTCRMFKGDVSVPWHNSSLGSEWQRILYEAIISNI